MMEGIVHIRIDDRLLHGQVCALWGAHLKLSRIMVANDAVAIDEIQKTVLRMAAPSSMRTSIITLERAAENIAQDKYAGQRVLVILKNPEDAMRLVKSGLPIKKINVGNMASREGTKQYKRSINLTDDEVNCFKKLKEMGVELTAQMVPDEAVKSLFSFIDK